jgi:arylsulfatase A-like enzyme/predicted Zn-dependent protease
MAVVVIAVLAAAVGYWTLRSGSDRRWNVLLVTFDTTRADHLPSYGYEHIRTPAIDALARTSIVYDRCYSPVPLTLPSQVSLMTGLYPFYHGIRINGTAALDANAVTLAEILRSAGYTTGAVVGAYVLDARFGLDQGFDAYDDDLPSNPAPSKFFYVERNAEAVTDAALDWLEEAGDGPLFLWVHYFDPHAPYEAPGYRATTATTSAYDAEIVYADTHLARLLDRARDLGRETRRRTLIVFAGDHGESLWNHGEPTHGLLAYDDTLRVPLIVRLPADDQAPAVIDDPVSLVDVFPSVLHWLDIPLPHETHGRILPTSADGPPGAARPLYFETHMPLHTYGWSPLEGVIVGDHKYIEAPTPELYDLSADPLEARNLLLAEGDPTAAHLDRALDELRQASLGVPALREEQPSIDEQVVRRLEALGYLTGGTPAPTAEPLADPKDMIDLHRRVDQGQSAIDEGDLPEAMTLLQDVLAADPDNPRVLLLWLHLLAAARDEVRRTAVGVLEHRLADPLPEPFDALVPYHLGAAALGEGRLDEAEAMLRRALEADPDDAGANYALARTLITRTGTPESALAHFERAHDLDGENREYALALGQCLELAGRYEEALGVYERLLERDLDDPVALNNSAWVLFTLRQGPEAALERSERAVRLQPADPRLRHTLGAVLLWRGRPRQAADHLQRAVKIDPAYAAAHFQLGIARQAMGNDTGAASALARAIELAGDPPPAWLDDARLRLEQARGP